MKLEVILLIIAKLDCIENNLHEEIFRTKLKLINLIKNETSKTLD